MFFFFFPLILSPLLSRLIVRKSLIAIQSQSFKFNKRSEPQVGKVLVFKSQLNNM